MMKKIVSLSTLLLALMPFHGFAANTVNVTGKVTDATNNDNVEFAIIEVLDTAGQRDTNFVTTSKEDGTFTLNNVPDDYQILVHIMGYTTQTLPVSSNMNIELERDESTTTLATVNIGASVPNTNTVPLAGPEPISNTPDKPKSNPENLATKQQAYDDAKSNEQSLANRTLTAATTAATGIGAMELMQGLAEQKSDKDADKDMAAYIATFRCKYADGKQVKGGSEEIELPGGNNSNMMKYRSEYVALAGDLKTRKEALGMTPGIEIQEILDKSQMGLYDDENTGITNGAYASIYRTQMLNSESDQQQIDADKQKSKNRVIGGAVAAGAGTIIGVGGNSLINGKLGDLIKDWKNNRTNTQQNNETIKALKKGLQSAGMKNVNKLDLSGFDMSALQSMVSNTDFSTLDLSGKDALTDINTSNPTSLASSLETLFGSK